jgi:16S rRNA (guanine527-N7)-methyltransferase
VKRLHELCRRLELPDEAERRLAALLELLASDPGAPTSVTAPAEAVDVHLADSLSVLPVIRSRVLPETLVDIGSGAGLPGLPLATALPGTRVDMLEATERKCRFISRAVERLELPNAHAVCKRAEDWARSEGAGRYDLATARALASLATVVEYASPLLREGGRLVAWKGARDPDEERQGAAAARALAMAPISIERVAPFPGVRNRHLHVYEKTGPTPAEVPRRPGIARKRPFGAE